MRGAPVCYSKSNTMATQARAVFANTIALLHLMWTLLLLVGTGLVFWWHSYAWMQIGLLSFTLLSNLPFGGHCPLTLLEKRARRGIDPDAMSENSYMVAYLDRMLGWKVRVRSVRIVTGVLYVLSYAAAIFVLVRP